MHPVRPSVAQLAKNIEEVHFLPVLQYLLKFWFTENSATHVSLWQVFALIAWSTS
jgi:hypothetical protein